MGWRRLALAAVILLAAVASGAPQTSADFSENRIKAELDQKAKIDLLCKDR